MRIMIRRQSDRARSIDRDDEVELARERAALGAIVEARECLHDRSWRTLDLLGELSIQRGEERLSSFHLAARKLEHPAHEIIRSASYEKRLPISADDGAHDKPLNAVGSRLTHQCVVFTLSHSSSRWQAPA
jgi:hypothetical protein